MPKTNTKYTSQHIDNQSFDDDFQVKLTGHIKYDDPANPTSISRTNLATEETLQAVLAASGGGKATNMYGYQSKSTTATHKYFFYEDASLNWYIMRKTIATGVMDYTKGTGGYASVYVDSTSAPSGSPTFASYGNTF